MLRVKWDYSFIIIWTQIHFNEICRQTGQLNRSIMENYVLGCKRSHNSSKRLDCRHPLRPTQKALHTEHQSMPHRTHNRSQNKLMINQSRKCNVTIITLCHQTTHYNEHPAMFHQDQRVNHGRSIAHKCTSFACLERTKISIMTYCSAVQICHFLFDVCSRQTAITFSMCEHKRSLCSQTHPLQPHRNHDYIFSHRKWKVTNSTASFPC